MCTETHLLLKQLKRLRNTTNMLLDNVISLLQAKIYNEDGINPEKEITHGFTCDLMSDALMLARKVDIVHSDTSILITGLVTSQSIRTAQMLDIDTIIFVRGKVPPSKLVDLAIEEGVTLLSTNLGMHTTSGKLYSEGIKGYDS